MTVAEALATLLAYVITAPADSRKGREAHKCVEAEIARLGALYSCGYATGEGQNCGKCQQCLLVHEHFLKEACEQHKAEIARLEQEREWPVLRANAAEAEAARLRDGLRRIEQTCAGVVQCIAEVGEPPAHWSGTQIDAERMRDFARALLAEDGAA